MADLVSGTTKAMWKAVVSFTRLNFMAPIPRFESWGAFNAHLEKQCGNRSRDVLRGHRESICTRLVFDH